MECQYCGKEYSSNVSCAKGHYICDRCHGLSSLDLIEKYCNSMDSQDPISMAITLMHNPKVNMHGPEHHFLVSAVLLTAYYNAIGERDELSNKLKEARERGSKLLGGSCGYYGACSAGVGTGMFLSLITGTTPVSQEDWNKCHHLTSNSLKNIANVGGPRCCKRSVFISILQAADFLKKEYDVALPVAESITCEFSHMNNECLGKSCPFFMSETHG